MQNTRSIIDALSEPQCYPHATTAIRVVETHISWVLLTGQYAYKIKKPVRLSFVDFSTLESRQYFCEEELRLNRRFAPSIYLGVSRITMHDSGPRIDSREAGPVVEYAVRLRQFAADDELTRLISNDAADTAMLREFGRHVGAVHRVAARAAANSAYGTAATTRRIVADNLADLAALTGSDVNGRIAAELTVQMGRLGASLDERFENRRRDGWVRECHGDLHAANVVRLDDRLMAFDCLEFDPALRFIDVQCDVAFLHMDLGVRHRADLAYAFLDGWLERVGDYAGLEVLAYYAAYRALVRAKVAALTSRPPRGDGTTSPAGVDVYLHEAARLLRPRHPGLVITVGTSGSGKTWLSERLVPALPAVRVRSDVERKRLAGLSAGDRSRSVLDAGIYTREFNELTYARLIDCARHALQSGETTIIDAAFLRRGERESAHALADELRVPYVQLFCDAPPPVLRERITQRTARGKDASEATLDVLDRQLTYFEPLTPEEVPVTVRVDTADTDALLRALDGIAQWARAPRS